jgi:hypothetical protein
VQTLQQSIQLGRTLKAKTGLKTQQIVPKSVSQSPSKGAELLAD